MREQVKSLSSIGLSVVSLSDLKKIEAEKVLGKAAHSVVFDKRQPEICLCLQAIVNSETETFFRTRTFRMFIEKDVSFKVSYFFREAMNCI